MLKGPVQRDNFNCGPYICKLFEAISRCCVPDFGVDNLPTKARKEERLRQIRLQMKAEILRYKLFATTLPNQAEIAEWEVNWDNFFVHVQKYKRPVPIVDGGLDAGFVDLSTQAPDAPKVVDGLNTSFVNTSTQAPANVRMSQKSLTTILLLTWCKSRKREEGSTDQSEFL